MDARDRIPRLGVSAIVWRERKALMVLRTKPPTAGLWSFPGGHVRWGERLRDAAARELLEETGVTAALDRLVDCLDVIRGNDRDETVLHYGLAVFAGRYDGGEAVAASDAGGVRWATLAEIETLPTTPGAFDIARQAARLLGI